MNSLLPKMFMAKTIMETYIKSVTDIVFLLYGSGSQFKEVASKSAIDSTVRHIIPLLTYFAKRKKSPKTFRFLVHIWVTLAHS